MTRFVPSSPARQAPLLRPDEIHVWQLPYDSGSGRSPFRQLMAHYLDTPASNIRFIDGVHGRPELADPPSDLSFNWSHTGSLAVLAIARSLPVLGIDAEWLRPRPRALALARRYFHPDEYAQLSALSPDRLEMAFLRLWTAKESVLKALGEGLRFGLDRICFKLHEDHVLPVDFASAAGSLKSWHLLRLDDNKALVSLAWRGRARTVHWYRLTTV